MSISYVNDASTSTYSFILFKGMSSTKIVGEQIYILPFSFTNASLWKEFWREWIS